MKVEIREFTGQACIFCRGPVIGKGVSFHFDVICTKCAKKIKNALEDEEKPKVKDYAPHVAVVDDDPAYVCEHCGLRLDDVKKYAIHQRWCKNRKKKDGLKTEALA